MTLRTEYDFTLPRGYVDSGGSVHKTGTMRLATARDELEPLRHPTVSGPDDPRLTLLILARVVTALGDLGMVTVNEMEGLFAADLAFLQDFYGVINFGTQEEYEALLAAQAEEGPALGTDETADVARSDRPASGSSAETPAQRDSPSVGVRDDANADGAVSTPRSRARVEEIPRDSV